MNTRAPENFASQGIQRMSPGDPKDVNGPKDVNDPKDVN